MDTTEALDRVRDAITLLLQARDDGNALPFPMMLRYERLGEVERRLLAHVHAGEAAPPELLGQVEELLRS